MSNISINYRSLDLDIDYDYSPEEPEVRYYSDGSGYPGAPAEFNLNQIMLGDKDLTHFFLDELGEGDEIEQAIYDAYDGYSD